MKFNFKRFTFFVAIVLVVVLAAFKLPKTLDRVTQNQGANFNYDFKNYNRILEVFDSGDVKIATFKVSVADTDEKRQHGLMNLDHLPDDLGMVFIFNPSQLVTMWMKNTLIPLDMIFIDTDEEISSIAHNTTPKSLDIISSQKEVAMVLEINGGISEKLGLKVGQKVRILNKEK